MIDYPFECQSCQAQFTHDKQDGHPKCPQCGSKRTERVFDNGGAQFHGEDFTKASKEPPHD